ncbi:MAG: LysM peptidoglycan-binding domain-containing protein [Proteobacteria bacterium]|nr:LysM peptidoglycan-binding domain-containing protein [Pseudomonadota bacterium]MCP4600236.1 LysM peptidoglycan-binding domain-containing protein [Pseudomonadota bacterium]
MRHHQNDPLLGIMGAVFFLLTLWCFSLTAKAAGTRDISSQEKDTARVEYEIKSGETLGAIAMEYGFSLDDIMAINGIHDPNQIYAGQKLTIPTDRAEQEIPKPAKKESKQTPFDHEVKPGETLGAIAIEHGYTLDAIMQLNHILDPNQIYAGQKLLFPGDPKDGKLTKAGVVLPIPKGFNLTRIAAAYDIPLRSIIRANRIENPNRLRAGQKILVPGARRVVKLVLPPPCYQAPVSVLRVRSNVSKEVSLCFCNGKPNPKAITEISAISGPKGTENPFPLHPRLAVLLQKIADEFPGKRIEIVSGQRTKKQKNHESYHNKGQALDFRVAGVSNRKLTRFVRKFKNVGVGYYPNSVFIHMDTREKNGYWIDYSRPGEKPIYAPKGLTNNQLSRIREKRQTKETKNLVSTAESKSDKNIETVAVGTKLKQG